jgi:hypothetical protein
MSDAIQGLDTTERADAGATDMPGPDASRARRQAVLAIVAGAGTLIVAAVALGWLLLRPAPAPSVPPVATPLPSTGAVRGEVAVGGLLALVQAPDRTWQVDAVVELWRDGARGDVRFTATVAGTDSTGSLSGSLIAGDHDWVVLGEHRWRRIDGGTWKSTPKLPPNRGWDPFAGLDDDASVRFIRWEQKDAVRYAQVSIANLLVLDPTAYFAGPYEVTDVADATLYLDVDADGRPARGTAQATVAATDANGRTHEFKLRAAYTFTRVGDPLVVERPSNG